ncbi:sigma-70 family RNA polymerase sigma factor [Agrococcus sp. SL85]|uniref:sigma-70 family RNA polymerase sigma factor n=1 Tax=Agrococcus sp. SL85 TaxID=2995141 RepID=UPI00226CE86F|nr:sigma-70 family RNA polymerase sigma factor [Agrococcus sp. SL85]WAC66191.1 sigma-70 family RNA polymerase sigma factor [Agrococcus sp. SL85]
MEHGDAPAAGFDAARAFDLHAAALLGFAVNALRDRALAEDCLQETFLRAWRARDRFDPARASERTWLFAIARNVVADALRGRGRSVRADEGEPRGRARGGRRPARAAAGRGGPRAAQRAASRGHRGCAPARPQLR